MNTTFPVDEYPITEEQLDTSRFTVDDVLPEMHLSRTGGWYRADSGYCEYYLPFTGTVRLYHVVFGEVPVAGRPRQFRVTSVEPVASVVPPS